MYHKVTVNFFLMKNPIKDAKAASNLYVIYIKLAQNTK